MGNRITRNSYTPDHDSEEETLAEWWRRVREPVAIGVALMGAFALPLVLLFAGASIHTIIIWMPPVLLLAGGLIMPRLQRIIQEGRVSAIIAVAVILGLAFSYGMQATSLVDNPERDISTTAQQTTQPLGPQHSIANQLLLVGHDIYNACQALPAPASPTTIGFFPATHLPFVSSPPQLALPEDNTFAASSAASNGLTFRSSPRISRTQFSRVLQRGNHLGPSPAGPVAGELYTIITGYGLDPAVALAFFAAESQYGNDGVCNTYNTKNWGNLRAPVNWKRVSKIVHTRTGPYVKYRSWQDGMRDWCELILYRYIKRGLDTVEEALPVYAPSSDGNSPARYTWKVQYLVTLWQHQEAKAGTSSRSTLTVQTGPQAGIYNGDLASALFQESFVAAGMSYRPDWAFHQYALKEARAGRALGSPVGESRRIQVDGKKYAVQVFAFDTLYTPITNPESETNWNDVRRLSNLLRTSSAQRTPGQ